MLRDSLAFQISIGILLISVIFVLAASIVLPVQLLKKAAETTHTLAEYHLCEELKTE